MEPPIAWVADKNDFKFRMLEVYAKAMEFDGISPETPQALVVFTDGNPYAEKYRKMLH